MPSTGVPQNDLIGDTLTDVYRRGWPDEAAKQLFVVMLAAYAGRSISEGQFVAEQFKKCQEVAAKSGPKYSNVHIGLYSSAEEKASAKSEYQQVQREQLRRNQILGPCLQYKAKAMMVRVYKDRGICLEDAINYTASSAYGPGGIAYPGSQETEALLEKIVRAGYENNQGLWRDERGQPTKEFGEYAFAMCMGGTPF